MRRPHLAAFKVSKCQHSADEAWGQLGGHKLIGCTGGRSIAMALVEVRGQQLHLGLGLAVDALGSAHRVLGRLRPPRLQEADVPCPELCANIHTKADHSRVISACTTKRYHLSLTAYITGEKKLFIYEHSPWYWAHATRQRSYK